ncbi:50S ribosomal protein L23 [Nanobdella aerobiophila]|uniref:Large ribosomal subunit protein uL23 n=1 Tax=Nanobdella aerobiophila TaxID=2586965 RepID=A0A915SYB2_9ARCH|nr:50S ribosomal protein L23 [Nanobdella aerobiophila]BBL45680.1 50S ribosomal protein L23 [Nanobdella aerobiophila]
MDINNIILYAELTEKDLNILDKHNKVVFIVNRNARKKEIKDSVEKLFNVKVEKVNTLIDSNGNKKAYIKLKKDYKAQDILSRLGLM